jgi:hypothetical protein
MVPTSLLSFFAQDPFNGNRTNRDLDTHPKSLAERNDFLAYFNQTTSSPQQSFENVPGTTSFRRVSFRLSTIGNVVFRSNSAGTSTTFLQIVRDDGLDVSTAGRKALHVLGPTSVNIVFPVVVVGVGFTVFDLERAMQLQFISEGNNVGSFTIPLNTSADNGGFVFIGCINYIGFDTIHISAANDIYWIDQFTAYKASELL